MEICIAVIVIMVLIVIKVWYDRKTYGKRLHSQLLREWGEPEQSEYTAEKLEAIRAFYNSRISEGDIDDITWNDLELDLVYQQINHTQSAMGQEYLYNLLRKPELVGDTLAERERLVCFFMEKEPERLNLQMKLVSIGKMGKFSVYTYLSNVKKLKKENSLWHIIQMLAFLVSAGLCFVWPYQVILITIAIAVYNMVTYYQRKTEMDKYYQLFAYIVKTVRFAKDVARLDIPELKPYFERLREKAGRFDQFCRGSGLVVGGKNMQGDLLDTLFDYVRLLTHIDIIKFQSMSREAVRLEDDLMEMYEIIGFLDSMISIASYRVMMGPYCVPELGKRGASEELSLEAEQLYHPLISDPVKNTIHAKRSVLLTGSNASGKSTFIKTVAINAILAQTIHTVLADRYKADYFRIYSSMALRDDIMNKESYYIVEIKSLKRIVDEAGREDVPVLCFIDEVLRGTNTVERIASSSQILAMLARSNTMCFAATHDIELTSMLENLYDNYHFEERVIEDDVIFDYQLRQGKAMTRNAIKLLGMIGYQENIIAKAEDSVQHFLKTGEWRI